MSKKDEALRLFIALHVPPELGRMIVQYEKELPFWRWTGARELHMTIRFIGDVQPDKLDDLVTAFENGYANQRKVRFTTIGYGFNPSERRASSIHLQMQRTHALEELKEKTDKIVFDSLGLPAENRSFHPHVTLARFQRPPIYLDMKRLKAWADEIPKLPEPFAPAITLYKSELTKHGAIHTAIAEHELECP